MPPLPVALQDISADWICSVLSAQVPGLAVTRAEPGEVMQGTATKVRMRLEYNEAGRRAGLPDTLIVKGGFAAHSAMMAPIYELEARFYRELAPRLDLRLPRCFFAGTDPSSHQSIVILEDLQARGATFCRVQQPLAREQAAAYLCALASLHARWWDSPELEGDGPLAWLEPLDPLPEGQAGTYQRGQLRPDVYAHYMSLPRGTAVSRYFHDRDRMERAMERLRVVDRQGVRCMLHADPHLGNLYIDADGTAGILDWQSIGKGPWSHDVAYFLVSSLDMLDRRAWERSLLQLYLDELRSHGVEPPTLADAWEAYACQLVYGLYYWLVNPVDFQAEINNCAVAPRFAQAAMDHGTFERLLGS